MKRPLYYLLCAISCTSMVSATLPMAAIAEAMQPRATAEQQAQADATSSDTGKAEDAANTDTTADTVEDSTATSTGTSAVNTESADATNAGTTAATTTPRPIPPSPNHPHAQGNLRHVTNHLRPLRHGNPKRRHLHRLVERRPRGHRDDLPRNPDQRLVLGQGAHGRAHLLGRRQPGKRLRPVAPGMGRLLQPGHRGPRLYLRLHGIGHVPHLLLLYGQRQIRPQNDKGIYYLRTTAEVTVNDAARPSVAQIVNNAVAQCRQETDGSEYDMTLWLQDWTLDQLEYDHNLNWCSAESGLTRHQGTCESYQRIYSKLLDAAGIANGRITGNGHTWNAVKIDGKWRQMDLTWDDTSDNWYGDLEQHLAVARAVYSSPPCSCSMNAHRPSTPRPSEKCWAACEISAVPSSSSRTGLPRWRFAIEL